MTPPTPPHATPQAAPVTTAAQAAHAASPGAATAGAAGLTTHVSPASEPSVAAEPSFAPEASFAALAAQPVTRSARQPPALPASYEDTSSEITPADAYPQITSPIIGLQPQHETHPDPAAHTTHPQQQQDHQGPYHHDPQQHQQGSSGQLSPSGPLSPSQWATQDVVVLHVERSDPLLPDPLLTCPIVRVHIVDPSTGELIADMNTATAQHVVALCMCCGTGACCHAMPCIGCRPLHCRAAAGIRTSTCVCVLRNGARWCTACAGAACMHRARCHNSNVHQRCACMLPP